MSGTGQANGPASRRRAAGFPRGWIRWRVLGPCVALLGLVSGAVQEASAQGFRGWTQTRVRYLELQPMQLDTAQAGDVVYDANGDARVDGRLVWCTTTPCDYFRPAPIRDAVVGSQGKGDSEWEAVVEQDAEVLRERHRPKGKS